MTDGPTLPVRTTWVDQRGALHGETCRCLPPVATIDLSTFTQWIELQPVSTDVSLLYGLAADVARKGWGSVAFEIRRAANDLKALTRCKP